MKNQLLMAFLFEVAVAQCQWEVTDSSAAGPFVLTETLDLLPKFESVPSFLSDYYDQHRVLQDQKDLPFIIFF